MLTQDSIMQFYKDSQGNEYLCLELVKPCCSVQHYLLKDFNSVNIHPYNASGERLDYKLKPALDSSYNLVFD